MVKLLCNDAKKIGDQTFIHWGASSDIEKTNYNMDETSMIC